MTDRFRLSSILGFLAIGLCVTPVVSAQPARYVDPADDERLLPFGGHVLTDRGDAQIVRFRNWDRFNPVRRFAAGTTLSNCLKRTSTGLTFPTRSMAGVSRWMTTW